MMGTGIRSYTVLLVIVVLVLNAAGCYQLFGPSDEEVIKAIYDTGFFSGGVEKYSLKSAIKIIEKGPRNSDGSWRIKIKATVTFTMTGGRETSPKERTSVFRIYKSKDSSGKTVWKADAE